MSPDNVILRDAVDTLKLGVNLLDSSQAQNGELEWAGVQPEISPEHVRSGPSALRVTGRDGEYAGAILNAETLLGSIGHNLPCEPNTKYVIRAWIKSVGKVEGFSIQMHAFGNDGANFPIRETFVSNTWQELIHIIEAPATMTQLAIYIGQGNRVEKFDFVIEDVSVYKIIPVLKESRK